ncbi:hypothetical protein GCM10023217_06440 [Gordonia alkaliphila]|uniref:Uncharacterized protein n=1 Tax=Gordonia alkaliphila TaxID=1053547 RepID=A0ABP8YX21_9ACTN
MRLRYAGKVRGVDARILRFSDTGGVTVDILTKVTPPVSANSENSYAEEGMVRGGAKVWGRLGR